MSTKGLLLQMSLLIWEESSHRKIKLQGCGSKQVERTQGSGIVLALPGVLQPPTTEKTKKRKKENYKQKS